MGPSYLYFFASLHVFLSFTIGCTIFINPYSILETNGSSEVDIPCRGTSKYKAPKKKQTQCAEQMKCKKHVGLWKKKKSGFARSSSTSLVPAPIPRAESDSHFVQLHFR